MSARTTTSLCHGACGAVLPSDVLLCRPCRTTLVSEVQGANDLLRELDITLARQDKVTPPRTEGKSSVIPMPFHGGASTAARDLRASVRALAVNVDRTAIARFRVAREHALATIDLPDPGVFLGQCDCGTAVYARTGQDTVQCVCGRVWEAAQADGTAAFTRLAGSMPRLRRWLLALGVVRSRAQLYRDVAGLEPVGTDDHGRVYRLADVWDQVTRATQQKRGA